MIRFACPNCDRTLQAEKERVGATVVCPGCQQHFTVPQDSSAGNSAADSYREADPMPAAASRPPRSTRDDDDGYDDDEAPRRRPTRRRADARSGNWAWRCVSPSMLLFALLMLPLPFLEVRCTMPDNKQLPLIQQSGLQVLTGGSSKHPDIARFENQPQIPGVPARIDPLPLPNLDVKPAYLMWAVVALLLAAMVVGLAIRPTVTRVSMVFTLIVLALGTLVVQMAIGFPLEGVIAAQRERAPMPQVNGPFAGVDAMAARSNVQTAYHPCLWIWLIILVLALGPLVAEALWSAASRQPRWAPAYDADDYG